MIYYIILYYIILLYVSYIILYNIIWSILYYCIILYIYHIIIRTRVYTVARGSDLYNFLTEVENLCGWRLNRLEDIQERERERACAHTRLHSYMLPPKHSAPPPIRLGRRTHRACGGDGAGPAPQTETRREHLCLGGEGGGWSGGTTGYIFTDGEGYLYIYMYEDCI